MATRLIHLLCLFGAISLPLQPRPEALRIEGRITEELFRPVKGSPPSQTVEAEYSVTALGTNWTTRVVRSGSAWDYVEAGNHEGNVFTLVSLQTRGRALGANEYAGRVLRGPVPHVYLSGSISVLWYVYAASDYLHSLSNSAAEPALLPLGTDRELHK